MHWLVLTEHQRKAEAFRSALPDAVCISTRGMPWEAVASTQAGNLHYTKTLIPNYQDTLSKILSYTHTADRILLAFDPTPLGEAIAREFESTLPNPKCARWPTNSLHPRDIQKTIAKLESLSHQDLPKAHKGLSSNYWCQRVMDITWAHQISKWLKTHTDCKQLMTRLMASILKTVLEEHTKKALFRDNKFWEIHAKLTRSDGTVFNAPVIVPTFAQFSPSTPPKTREYWLQRIEENRTAILNGHGIPQPPPGHPWRYRTLAEAEIQKHHLQKFPFFAVESIQDLTVPDKPTIPETYSSLMRRAKSSSSVTPEHIQKALHELFCEGYITFHKSNNPNLSPRSVTDLLIAAQNKGWNLSPEPRLFSQETLPGNHPTTEAIRPTDWNRHYDDLETLLPPKKHKTLKIQLYKIIYRCAVASQLQKPATQKTKLFLSGPLYLTTEEALRRNGTDFHFQKEQRFSAHMNVILCAEPTAPSHHVTAQQNEILECSEINILENHTNQPNPLDETQLLDLMACEGLGSRDTLKTVLKHLHEIHFLTSSNPPTATADRTPEIELTLQGHSIIRVLNHHFGQYLHPNYHRAISESLALIDCQKLTETDFLNEWWSVFRSSLGEAPASQNGQTTPSHHSTTRTSVA